MRYNGNNIEDTTTRRAILPATPEVIAHDADGNMTSDGLWNYSWDAENRLIRITAKPGAAPWFDSPTLMEYKYDWMGRRIESAVYGPLGNVVHRTKFLWDRWNILAQSDWGATPTGQGTVLRAYVWGNDLSGSEQGAGGVGGLLAVQAHEPGLFLGMYGTLKTYCPTYDGNGNVMSYINAATGAVEQEEEYGPFGENLRPRSTNILRCPIGWSTKYTDEETGLVAYQLRYYNPTAGRWMSRDPIGEDGGVNLVAISRNCPTQLLDYLGLVVLMLDVNAEKVGNTDFDDESNERFKQSKSNMENFIKRLDGVFPEQYSAAQKAGKITLNGKAFTGSKDELKRIAQREAGQSVQITGKAANFNQSLEKLRELKAKAEFDYDEIGVMIHGVRVENKDPNGNVMVGGIQYNQIQSVNAIRNAAMGSKGQLVISTCFRTWKKGMQIDQTLEYLKVSPANGKVIYNTQAFFGQSVETNCKSVNLNTARIIKAVGPEASKDNLKSGDEIYEK